MVLGLLLPPLAAGADFKVAVQKDPPYPLSLPAPGPAFPPPPPTLAEEARAAQAAVVARTEALIKSGDFHPLGIATMRLLSHEAVYAQIDVLYERRSRENGAGWTDTPEAKSIFALRKGLQDAALSAKVEPVDGRPKVVFTPLHSKQIVLGNLVPSVVETDADVRANVAAAICDLIIDLSPDDRPVTASIRNADLKLGLLAVEARERGLAAAARSDWPAAITAFTEALGQAHATPGLMFNLGRAYQLRGWKIPAAMWYRAYLAAVPEAANAEAVRAETERLVAAIKEEALHLFDEAEQLAEALPAKSLVEGAKSLRQASLEAIARYALMGGLADRGTEILTKARALAGVRPLDKIQDAHGFYAAYRSLDADRTRQIQQQWGAELPKDYLFTGLVHLYGQQGKWDEVQRVFAASDPKLTLPSFIFAQHRGFDAAGINSTRVMNQATEFDADWFTQTHVAALELVFYGGRPDVAVPLARTASAYLKKYKITGRPEIDEGIIWLQDAMLGDRAALKASFSTRYSVDKVYPMDDPDNGMLAARTALMLAATFPSSQAVELIDEMIRKVQVPNATIPVDRYPRLMPLTYFARWAAAGDDRQALKSLDDDLELAPDVDPAYRVRTQKENSVYLTYALRFAVATGRGALALELADRKAGASSFKLTLLNQLAVGPGATAAVKSRVNEYAAMVGGGWRPRDATQAWAVANRLDMAEIHSNDEAYRSLAEVLEAAGTTAKDKSETLPQDLAASAVVWWVAAQLARPDL